MSTVWRRLMSNQDAWRHCDLVEQYSRAALLTPPEVAILSLLAPRLAEFTVLDVGVGGGRTAVHLLDRVKEYVGIDYSEPMIAACKARFGFRSARARFEVCDARSMSMFGDEWFDLVLFSFNGIDYVTHEHRLAVYREIQRVGKRGGFFAFSTHNLQHLRPFEFRGQFGGGLRRTAGRLMRCAGLRLTNRVFRLNALRQAEFAVINDGVHDGRFWQYAIRPASQLTQLAPFFCDTQVFRMKDGSIVTRMDELERIDDPWLYYLCRLPSAKRRAGLSSGTSVT